MDKLCTSLGMVHTADFGAKKFKTGTSLSLTSEKYSIFKSGHKKKIKIPL